MTTVRLISFSLINPKSDQFKRDTMIPFFDKFNGYHLKYFNQVITKPDDNLDDLKLPDCKSSEERREACGKDAVAALTDNDTDIIWLFGGGNPGDIDTSQQIVIQFIYEIHRNSIHLHSDRLKEINFIPKTMVGYCLLNAVTLYLSGRGLVKAVHGEVANCIHGVAELGPLYKQIFNQNYHVAEVSELQPENDAALKMIQHQTEISGLICGGLLQLIYHSFLSGILMEKMDGVDSVISNRPMILFIELIKCGNEEEIARKLFKLIAENGIQIKALAIAHIADNVENIDGIKREVCTVANTVNIPVVSGLKIGHFSGQTPYLEAPATLKFDTSINKLKITYDQDVKKQNLGLLKHIKPEQMWNKKQLQDNNIEPSKDNVNNVSDALCVIL
eukprot:CAMPEP_0201572570 /NCGR_PEP_ID=MMETSP0190_2-20130828/15917_1 /ASSEMBLY_ACC=CAM_ASM_000263 /TAXON_ID=37353 /ORGANISM="Rosalina sp." /LENGTH=388 /DNA_ID=CAMNT_0047998499 /DNA_START=43 /DNA_END=1209 /DNA_ORIENTATION=+